MINWKMILNEHVKMAAMGNINSQDLLIELSELSNTKEKTAFVADGNVTIKNEMINVAFKMASHGDEDSKELFKMAKVVFKDMVLTKESFVFPEAMLNPGVDIAANAAIGAASGGLAGNALTDKDEDMKKRRENTTNGIALGAGLGGLGSAIARYVVGGHNAS